MHYKNTESPKRYEFATREEEAEKNSAGKRNAREKEPKNLLEGTDVAGFAEKSCEKKDEAWNEAK